jgi:uncharacterized repeat protein (TIGR01451 family)
MNIESTARRFTSKRSRTRYAAIAAALATIGGTSLAVTNALPAQAAFPGTAFETLFEIDGNRAVDTVGNQDWANADTAANLNDVSETADGCASGPDSIGTDADRVVPGTKLDNILIESPPVSDGTPNKKSDLCSVHQAWELVKVPANADPQSPGQYNFIYYGAWSRPDVGGEIDVLFPLLGDIPGSNDDDLIISYDFDDSNPPKTTVEVLDWNGTAWGLAGTLTEGTDYVAQTTKTIDVGGPFNVTFGEFAINLTTTGILPESGACKTFTTGDPVTRTGNSATASMEDIVEVPPVELTNCGTLTVKKTTRPATPSSELTFSTTTTQLDGAVIQDGKTQLDDDLVVPDDPEVEGDSTMVTHENVLISPDYTIVENGPLPDGWTQESLVCSSYDPIAGTTVERWFYGTEPLDTAFPVAPGEEAICEVTNVGPPTLSVYKQTIGGVGGPFEFTVGTDTLHATTTAAATPTLVDDGTIMLTPDTATTVQETDWPTDPGFVPVGLRCVVTDGDQTISDTTVQGSESIDVTASAGQDAVCTQTNLLPGSITVQKVVNPSTATGWSVDFTISPAIDGQDATKTATPGNPSVTWDNLAVGQSYTVTESDTGGLFPSTASCTSTAAPGEPTGTLATDPDLAMSGLSSGEEGTDSIACQFTNIEPAQVQVTKTVSGTTTPWAFDFTIAPVDGNDPVPSPSATQTATDTSKVVTWTNLIPGHGYTITETGVDGYITGTLVCGGEDSTGTSTFTPDPGETVYCSITNTELASVQVTKTVTGTDLDWSFDFTISPAVDGQPATKTATKASPVVGWDGILPGKLYTITETAVDGYTAGTLVCGGNDAVGTSDFAALPGEDVSCAITNTAEPGSVQVTKTVEGASGAWSFDFTISPVPAGETATKSATNASPTVGWDGLVPGVEYEVTETPVAGYIAGTLSCSSGQGGTFTPGLGEDVTCGITNTGYGSVSVTKTVDPGDETGWSYDFTISPVPAGETATKTATSAAPTVSWANLVGGQAYTVTEQSDDDLVVGTMTCTGGENSTGTSTFTPTAGQAVSCEVTNTRIADIAVVKTAPAGSFLPGANATWTIQVSNNGPSTALDVVLDDEIPTSLGLVSVNGPASWDCSATVTGTPGTVSCTKPDMLPGETWMFEVTTSVLPNTAPGQIENVATVSTTTSESTTANNIDSASMTVEAVAVLPPTGSSVRKGVVLGGVLLALGIGLVLAAAERRRRTT